VKLRTRVTEHVHERIDGEKVDAPAREVTDARLEQPELIVC